MNADQQLTEFVWTPEFLLTELADVGVFTIGLDLKIKSWSPGVENIFGYTKRDFIGRDASFIFTPEDRAQGTDEREFEQARRSGRSSDMRWHIKKDGGRVFVDGVLTAIRDESGEHLGYVKILRDIFPDPLRQRVIATVLDETPLAISIRDCEGRFAFVNSPLAKLIGKPAAEIIGRFIDDILPPSMAAPIRQDDGACIRLGTPRVIEEYFLSADQGRRTLLTGKAPLLDHQGRMVGVISISQDITSRKQQSEEREVLLRELRKANENLAEFSFIVSHDLQAPVRTIKSFAELLARNYKEQLDQRATGYISLIARGAENMHNTIHGLMRFAQSRERSLAMEPASMEAVLAGALLDLQAPITEKAAEISHSELPSVYGDASMLHELLQNLIGNALKYARPDVPPRIEVSSRQISDGEYEFCVRDNGIGIPTENLEAIFAPLKRLHGQEIAGAGIGLAICRKIVERHGGRIWARSQFGTGSTFCFTLPVTPRQESRIVGNE